VWFSLAHPTAAEQIGNSSGPAEERVQLHTRRGTRTVPVDQLRRIVRSGQATPGEVAERLTAKQALAAAETQRQLALDTLDLVSWSHGLGIS